MVWATGLSEALPAFTHASRSSVVNSNTICRKGRNPNAPTNEAIIPERVVVKFRAGKKLNERVGKLRPLTYGYRVATGILNSLPLFSCNYDLSSFIFLSFFPAKSESNDTN